MNRNQYQFSKLLKIAEKPLISFSIRIWDVDEHRFLLISFAVDRGHVYGETKEEKHAAG